MKTLIITEANEKVASGHLMESISLAKKIIQEEQEVLLAVNDDVGDEWKPLFAELPSLMYKSNLDVGMSVIQSCLKLEEFDVVVTDVREIKETQIKRIRAYFGGEIICLDEWGNRELSCDVIVNNMLDAYFWSYGNTKAELYCGPQYLMLKQSLQKYHKKGKTIADIPQKIVITMGGVDEKNHTAQILQRVSELPEITTIDVVMGGKYKYETEIRTAYGNDCRVKFHKNIDYLFDLFLEDDVAFSAGGNTLYEMASIGIPSIVIPTMEHEKMNGRAFQKQGYGVVVDEKKLNEIGMVMASLSYEKRLEMYEKGRALVDGEGTQRIWNIIKRVFDV